MCYWKGKQTEKEGKKLKERKMALKRKITANGSKTNEEKGEIRKENKHEMG